MKCTRWMVHASRHHHKNPCVQIILAFYYPEFKVIELLTAKINQVNIYNRSSHAVNYPLMVWLLSAKMKL